MRFLGFPEVYLDEERLKFRTRKALALLAYLAAQDTPQPRQTIVDILWPRNEEKRGRAVLRSTLAMLRKTLREMEIGRGSYLLVEGDLLGLRPETGVSIDLRGLDEASSWARCNAGPGQSERSREVHLAALEMLGAAAKSYRGDFLEGFSLYDAPEFDYWIGLERERWRGRAEVVHDRLSRLQMEGGEIGEAISTAARWAEISPLNEVAYRRLMEVQFAADDREGALRTYENCRATLDRVIEAEPDPETYALVARIRAVTRGASSARPIPESTSSRQAQRTPSPARISKAPLVGRYSEIGALIGEYHAARRGQARVVSVTGEAGIGKTRLMEEFVGWARALGADVLSGGTFEAAAGLPYGALVEALRPRLDDERAPDDLLDDAWLSELSRLLPELKDRYPDILPPAVDESTAKGRLFEAVARFVSALSEREPVILFVDDLQWADVATLDLLRYALRRWSGEGARVLLAITARTEALGQGPLADWLSALERDLPAKRLDLGVLPREETLLLLRAFTRGREEEAPDVESSTSDSLERLGGWLHDETGGQPLFLVQTMGALFEKGVLPSERVTPGGPNPAVTNLGDEALRSIAAPGLLEVIRGRLAQLGPAALKLSLAGAVLGRGFAFEELFRVAGVEDEEGLEGLEELLRKSILRGSAAEDDPSLGSIGMTYSFAHDKIRNVAYSEAGDARRRVLHRRALTILEGISIPPAELAWHALAAGLLEPAFRHSLAAGDAAMEVFAHRAATSHYESARSLHKQLSGKGALPMTQPLDFERLYANLGRAYELVHDWAQAREVYEEVLTPAREAENKTLEAFALGRIAVVIAQLSGDRGTVLALIDEARRVAKTSGDPRALAEAEWTTALLEGAEGKSKEGYHASPVTNRVLRWEESAVNVLSRSLSGSSLAHRYLPNYEEAGSRVEAARAQYAAWGNRAMEAYCMALWAGVKVHRGDPQGGVRLAREARATVPPGHLVVGDFAGYYLAHGLLDTGEYGEALEVIGGRDARIRALGTFPSIFIHLVVLGAIHQATFALEEARAAYQEALELPQVEALPELREVGEARLSAVAMLTGDTREAYVRALRALEFRDYAQLPLMQSPRYYETEALVRAGDIDLARKDVRRYGEQIGENRRYRAIYLRCLAVLSRHEDDLERTAEHLREAAATAESVGLPGELWRAEAATGELLKERGEVEEAREAFARAATVVRILGSKIEKESVRICFLEAPQVRCMLGLC